MNGRTQYAILAFLQLLRFGGVLIDSSFTVVQANDAAQELFAKFDSTLLLTSIQPHLRDWFATDAQGYDPHRHESFVFDTGDGRPLAAICSLMEGLILPQFIVITLIDLNTFVLPRRSVLQELFGLTRAEAEVATHVARGRPAPQIAHELGSAVSTIRVQMKSVFTKTKTRRQSELAALLGRVSIFPPQRSSFRLIHAPNLTIPINPDDQS